MLSKNVIVLPEFATSTRVFSEVIGTCVQTIKKMSSLLFLCNLLVVQSRFAWCLLNVNSGQE